MKHTLRNAITKHQRLTSTGFTPQLAICIAVEFSKFMQDEIGSSSLYVNASNRYKNKPLFDWATREGLIETSTDEPEREIEPRDYFKSSPEIFDGIKYIDSKSNMRRTYDIYYREYFVSRAYFEDL